MNRPAHPVPSSQFTRFSAWSWAIPALLLGGACAFTAHPAHASDRVSLDEDWRFAKGDPQGRTADLSYAGPWHSPTRRAGESPAETDASSPTNTAPAGIKLWLLPAGNAFIKDPTRRFTRPSGNPGENVAYAQPGLDDSSWRQVNLPHDWAIEGPFTHTGGGGMGRLPSAGVGWYRKRFNLALGDSGKSIFLDVDGAMSYAAVWLNGQFVGGWPYGYASWRLDLSPYVHPGAENVLAIRLDNPPNSSRWYPGAGIYRNVWLVKSAPVHLGHWGTCITTPEVSPPAANVHASVTVDNDSSRDATVSVSTELFPAATDGGRSGRSVGKLGPVNLQIPAGASSVAQGTITIPHPQLWGPPPRQRPNRYVAVTTLTLDGQALDTCETWFGIRTLKFDPNAGLFINGEHVLLHGVCDHHDLGALGAALNYTALQRQLEMLKEMGCNAIRTSHNPPAPELLELTDRMGFVVMDEAFDCWQRSKTPNDYHLLFDDWHEQDLRAHVRRDRNCPSVVLWSIGNEVGEQFRGAAGATLARELGQIVHEEDPTRPTTSAMNWSQPTNPFTAALDVIGLNYQGAGIRGAPGRYPEFHEKFPDTPIVGSETASALSSRGEYLFPVATGSSAAVGPNSGEDRSRHQVSAYELYSAAFGASADKVFASQEQHAYVAGEFVWTGWDYLGEPTPFDSARSSYSGIIDLAGFKKDRFYLYQAHWRPELPMAHILPHWTWPERVGQVTPVHVFTSGDEGELFLNGHSQGRRKKGAYDYRLRWDEVVYQPGTLKVVTYKNGAKWATAEMKTAGSPARLKLQPDRNRFRPDGRDLSFITVTVTDQAGVAVPRADNAIHFDLEGRGEIVATDNGDPTSFESFPSHDRKAFNGLCLVIIRGKAGQPGTITLSAKAEALKPGKTTVRTTPAGKEP